MERKPFFLGYTRRGVVPYVASYKGKRRWEEIIVHHTWKPTVKDFLSHPDGLYWVRVIDRFHRSKGWEGIGYHFVLTPDGLIYVGRKLDKSGAHTVGHNATGIGVCLLGNFDDEDLTAAQWISLKYLLAWLCHAFTIPCDCIHFHREFANKTCPGRRLDLGKVREAVRVTMPEAVTLWRNILGEQIQPSLG